MSFEISSSHVLWRTKQRYVKYVFSSETDVIITRLGLSITRVSESDKPDNDLYKVYSRLNQVYAIKQTLNESFTFGSLMNQILQINGLDMNPAPELSIRNIELIAGIHWQDVSSLIEFHKIALEPYWIFWSLAAFYIQIYHGVINIWNMNVKSEISNCVSLANVLGSERGHLLRQAHLYFRNFFSAHSVLTQLSSFFL